MSVSLLILTHNDVGAALVNTATRMLPGDCPLPIVTLGISETCDIESISKQTQAIINNLDQGAGVLILTDMYGSTPANLACSMLKYGNVKVLTGINLPMLVRALNYPQLTLHELTERVITGGKDGIIECKPRSC
ncbi:hypothetical protein TI04_08070 [Achromatium sp. WMS2]|nr:hypothetical protein TI04_08070 [Achromatium sp. WMS2]